ncbi:hypothetical protein UVI_02009240 [Ustilaginoidea virens]|uniref:Uncharacterized protein n=1 Tax=Ustilaginoidea virens TaxID=1159556 RepID=A0A1B5KUN9_USTVR|nr:hypothetical protein UVI_02009240 [Ustilaginoidea virens]
MLASVGYQIDHRMLARPKHKGIRVPSNANSRPAKSQPVDAQELTERLFVVLAEQKARSQGKPCVTAGAERLAKTKAVSRPKASVVHASSIAVTSTSTSTSTSMSTTSRRDVPLSHDTEKPAPRAELSREDEAKTSSIKRRGKTNGNNARVDGNKGDQVSRLSMRPGQSYQTSSKYARETA